MLHHNPEPGFIERVLVAGDTRNARDDYIQKLGHQN
jgi:hypothetical protein